MPNGAEIELSIGPRGLGIFTAGGLSRAESPSLLLHAQARLRMTPTHLAIVVHLNDYWWHADRKPWPRKAVRVLRGPVMVRLPRDV